MTKGECKLKNCLISLLIILIMISSPFINISIPSKEIRQILDTVEQTNPKEMSLSHIWPMGKNDAQRTGRCIHDTSQNKGGEKWKYFVDSSIWEGVTIDKDGIIYVGTPFRGLHAVYPNGTLKWKNNLEGHEYQSPTIAPDGTIYVATDRFYAFYPNGTLKWISNLDKNFFTTPVVDSNGTVYASTQEGFIYAIYSNGTTKWTRYVQDFASDIALDKDENIYFLGEYDNSLTSLNPDGSTRWVCNNMVNMCDGPVIANDGTIYLAGTSYFDALYPNGTIKWTIDYSSWYGLPSIASDGTIICSEEPYITAINPVDGSIIWQYKFAEYPHVGDISSVAIGGDGTIYFAYDAYSNSVAFLCALNSDGSFKWETELTTDILPYDGVTILSDPSIGSDGTVYITSWFFRGGSNYTSVGYIHAIGMDNPITPDPPTIDGPSKVTLSKNYEYNLSCNISTEEEVFYFIDWNDEGDGVDFDINWIGPFPSGEVIKINHTFKSKGEHTIKVRAKSNDSLCSSWSTLDVTVPFSYDKPFMSVWEKIFDHFPNAFPILRYLLRCNQ